MDASETNSRFVSWPMILGMQMCKWKKVVLNIFLKYTLKDTSWSKPIQRFLTVFVEAKFMPPRVSIWLDTIIVRFLGRVQ